MGHASATHRHDLASSGGEGAGVVAAIDPRVRILAACAFAILVVALKTPAALGSAVVLALLLAGGSGLSPLRTVRQVAAMDGFVLFMIALLPFTTPGETVFSVGGFPASRQGLHKALEIAAKANAVLLALIALVGSMQPVTLGHALYRLRVPAKLVHLLLFTVRYIDVLHQEHLRLRISMKCRGFQPRNSLHTYRSFGYLVGMMLVRAIERSERILQAMKCRGFQGQFPIIDSLRLTSQDVVFCLMGGFAAALLVGLEVHFAVAY